MTKYRSGFEERVVASLEKENIPFLYECESFEYTLTSRYKPDIFLKNGVILELKGFWKPTDRRKHAAMKAQHPDIDIRLVFQRNNTITRTSKTTYGDFCDKHSIPWCVFPNIPQSWFDD